MLVENQAYGEVSRIRKPLLQETYAIQTQNDITSTELTNSAILTDGLAADSPLIFVMAWSRQPRQAALCRICLASEKLPIHSISLVINVHYVLVE